MVVIVNRKDGHFVIAVWAVQRIISKGQKYVITPPGKALKKGTFGGMYGFVERRITFAVSGIDAIIPCHFKIPLWDVLDQ